MPKQNSLGGLSFAPHEASQAVKHLKEIDRSNAQILERNRQTMRNDVQGMASYYHKKVFGKGEVFGKAGWTPERDNPSSAWDDLERLRLKNHVPSKTGRQEYRNGQWFDI